MKRLWRYIWCVLAAGCLLTVFLLPPAEAQIKEIRIADSKGDWGYPTPYRHYPRGPGYIRLSWVFDTLVWKGPAGYVPALAESWSYDAEKMAFTFKLNAKAKWHDGGPVTSEDVAFTIEYFKKHPYRWITAQYIDKTVCPDEHTAVVYLAEPYAPFISDIGGTMPILPAHIWKDVADPMTFDDPKSFIGSGPYLFRDFNKAQGSYLYEANADYHLGRPLADRLIYVKTGKAMVSLLGGQVDLANIQPEMAPALEKKGLKILRDERGWNKKLMINHKKPPYDDQRFRQALALAIDQQEIVDKAHRGLGAPASYGLLSVDHEMYNPATPTYAHNPEAAEKLFVALGYQKGPDGYYRKDGQLLKIELLASNLTVAGESIADRDGEVIKQQLQKVGIQVDLVNLEQTAADSRVRNWDFDLAVSGHGGIAGDARILAEMISSKYSAGSVNSARFDADPELNRLLEAQMREMDPDKRKEIVFNIQKVYADLLPAISLYYPDSMAAYNPEKGITWFYTPGGIGKGIPIPQNRMSLLPQQ